MRRLRRLLLRGLLVVAVMVAALVAVGPREVVPDIPPFDQARLKGGVDAYLAQEEAAIPGIRTGERKRVIWAGEAGARTPLSIVYLHGFSASSEEIRPVPDRVAKALHANLFFTRLRGHGRTSRAMAQASAADWLQDASEALAIGRAIGDRVLVVGTSTGGTLAALAMSDPAQREGVAGVVLISPNFGINNWLAPLLTWPGARYWLPLLAGETRSFTPLNKDQAAHWTTSYPSVAVFPMAALVAKAAAQDYAQVDLPALFYFSPEDKIVRPDITDRIAAEWGGPVTIAHPETGAGVDPMNHVIAGDIMSPANTDAAIKVIEDWAATLK